MGTPVLSEDVIRFLTSSGWRQFFLDQHFNLVPPCISLAELCNVPPQTLENVPLLNLFVAPGREKLQRFLDTLTKQQWQSYTVAAQLQSAATLPQAVELLIHPSPSPNAQPGYIGFMRPLTNALLTFPGTELSQPASARDRQIETVAQLSRHMAAILDRDALLHYAVESMSQNFEHRYVSIFLTDTTEAVVTLKAVSNIDITAIPTPAFTLPVDSSTVIGQVVVTAAPLLIGNVSQHPYGPSGHLPITTLSELAVPLGLGGQVLGVLDVQTDQPNYYGLDDLFLLQTIADQLAVAIENARLFEERDRRMAELAVFNQIGMVIARHQSLESILADILYRVNALFQVEAVSESVVSLWIGRVNRKVEP